MKKLLVLTALLFQLIFVFGQYGENKDCAESGCGDKSQNITRCWGIVRTFDQGIQIRVKGPIENCYNAINSESNRHSFMWHIEISGLKIVKQDCKLYVTGGDNRKSDYMIGSNTDENILTDKMTVDFFTFSNAETIGLEIIPTGNTSTNKNSTQQNDLTDYNNSKADLERQMADKNAEGQAKSQNYTQAMNAGIAAHNSGNYAEAKRQFSTALSNCNTEEARRKAKEYYDKTVGLERDLGKIQAVGNLVQGGIQILSDVHEKKMQKLNAELDESKRKQEIIAAGQAINTLDDPKIFETFVDYVAKNLEALNHSFQKIENYKNEEKEVRLSFQGTKVIIRNWWSGSMHKTITFITESESIYNNLKNSSFLKNLKDLNPHSDISEKFQSYEHSNFVTYGLEKTIPFMEVYNNGYNSESYKGFTKILNEFEKEGKQKLASEDNSEEGLLEKAEIYGSGLQGQKKNHDKALELYTQAYDKNKNKEILLKIGKLHKENSNNDKAIEYFERYITNNDNINPMVYNQLGWIYMDVKSPYYNVDKAKKNFEKGISLLEANYNTQSDESKKLELKKNIANTYSILGLMYNYYSSNIINVIPEISIPYYEKAIEWNEDNAFTAIDLMRLYAKDWKTGNFKRDTKKAKFWALKVCEIADRLERKNNESQETKLAKINCNTVKEHIKENFKSLKR
jgi:hypothetical protein